MFWVGVTGISQRDTSSYYHFILKEDEDITEDIQTFHRQKIGHKFPDVDCKSTHMFSSKEKGYERIDLILYKLHI